MAAAGAALALCASAASKPAIVHNDLYHLNLIEAERIYLIDWEYAAVADPIFDLACVLAYYPQAERMRRSCSMRPASAEPSAALSAGAAVYSCCLSFLWYRRRRLNCGLCGGNCRRAHAPAAPES